MRRLVSSFATLTLVVAAPGFAPAAFAHGGQYRGPAGEIPPDSREPSDPPPPPEGSGPQTPGGEGSGGPSTGGSDGGTPSTPGGSGAGGSGTPPSGSPPEPGGGLGGGAKTGDGRAPGASKGGGLSPWAFWWGNNKDEILQLKSSLRRGPVSGSAFGPRNPNALRTVTDRAIAEEIVPALHTLLADPSQSFHIRSAAELGLAKIGDTTIVPTLRAMALNADRSVHREIEETAALALGLMQSDDPETRAFLVGIVRDQAKDGPYTRPFAAISLGLLGDRSDREHAALSAMVEVIARREPGADIKSACLAGIGLLGNEAAVTELVAMVKNGKATAAGAERLTEVETAYAVAALGKIGKPGSAADPTCALDEVVRIVDKDKARSGLNVRRSAAIALGQIGPQCPPRVQRKVIDLLKDLVDGNTEEQERNFAVMSLARIGSAKTVDPAARHDVVSHLSRVMDKSRGQTPGFAAMALGLVGRAMIDAGGAAPEEEIRAPLRERFAAGGELQLRGAFALASGLVRDPLAVDALLKTLEDRGNDKRVRGWCALSLGLIGAREAVDAIHTTLTDDADRELRVQSAMAAGLLGDASVIEDVVAILKKSDASNYELGSAALALGQMGDERAIRALVEIALDKSQNYTAQTRSLAVVALGQIGDRRDVPTLARFATDVNYRAHVPSITELLTIL